MNDLTYAGYNPQIRIYSESDLTAIEAGNAVLGTLLVNCTTLSKRACRTYARVFPASREYLVDTGEEIESIRAMDDRTAVAFARAQFTSVRTVTRVTPSAWDMAVVYEEEQW